MFSGKTKRKIRHSSGRCSAPPPDWHGTTQVSSPVANGGSPTDFLSHCVAVAQIFDNSHAFVNKHFGSHNVLFQRLSLSPLKSQLIIIYIRLY